MLLNRGTVLVVIGERYARIGLYEFAMVAGLDVMGAPSPR